MRNPSATSRRATSQAPERSSLLTLINAVPEVGRIAPAPAWDLTKAHPKSLSIPMTSPVDFISGPRSTSTPANFVNGNTASFTERCVGVGAVVKFSC